MSVPVYLILLPSCKSVSVPCSLAGLIRGSLSVFEVAACADDGDCLSMVQERMGLDVLDAGPDYPFVPPHSWILGRISEPYYLRKAWSFTLRWGSNEQEC